MSEILPDPFSAGLEFSNQLMRSPTLMSCADTVLAVIDVQEKLLPLIPTSRLLAWNVGRLIAAARLCELPILTTEQYPQGLGPTVPMLAANLSTRHAKQSFSAAGCDAFVGELVKTARPKLLIAGMETHVCVQQTALDLLSSGYTVYVAADAVAARGELDHRTALDRMDSAGATITTTEAAIFEWCATSASAAFKEISRLIKQSPPI